MCVEIESRDDGDPTSSNRRDSLVQVDGLFSNCILQEDESTDDSPSELSHPAEDDEDDVDEDDVSDLS